jgi:hypothetical protein
LAKGKGRLCRRHRSWRAGDALALRKGAIASLGRFAGVGINAAQACDNDRFPCPVVLQGVTQETAAAPPGGSATQEGEPVRSTGNKATAHS